MSFDLFAIWIAGLATFLTPCVLPLVPIYLAALVGANVTDIGNVSRGRLLGRAALFALGFISVFTAMGLGASSFGAALSEHRSLIQIVGALLVALFALKFLGVVQIPFLDRIVRADDNRLRTRFGAVNALVMGVLFAAGWSPCIGPVLGSVLSYAASTAANPWAGAGMLALYGLGFAVPLLLIAAFADVGLKLVRRLRPALPRLEKAMGVLLLIIAGLMARDAAVQTPSAADAGLTKTEAATTVVTEHLPMMVELYERDCPICRRMAPIVERLVDQCDENGVRVRQIDVSEAANRHLVSEHRVVGVPTFLFLDEHGREVARLVGEQTPSALRQALAALRGRACPGYAMVQPPPKKSAVPQFDPPAPGHSCQLDRNDQALSVTGHETQQPARCEAPVKPESVRSSSPTDTPLSGDANPAAG